MTRLVLLAIVVAATAAHADVWEHAIAKGKLDPAQDKYDAAIRQGDEHTLLANTKGSSKKEVINQLQRAIISYRAAAATKPNEGEPYYRIGRLLYSFYFDCDPRIPPERASPLCPRSPTTFDSK